MLCLDVNVLVNGLIASASGHDAVRARIDEWALGSEAVTIPDHVALGFLRVSTHPRIFDPPVRSHEAWAELTRMLSSPVFRLVQPGPRHWEIFRELADQFDAHGNDLPDAYVAAYAVENGATLVSDDKGFGRFAGLSWRRTTPG